MEGGHPRKPYVKWGDKYSHISAATWGTKDTNQRLDRARRDLVQAGVLSPQQANELTVGSLNTAFNKLPQETRQQFLAMRKGQQEARQHGKYSSEISFLVQVFLGVSMFVCDCNHWLSAECSCWLPLTR